MAVALSACAPVSELAEPLPSTPSSASAAPVATKTQSPTAEPTYEPLVVLGAEWVSARTPNGNTTRADLRDEDATVGVITSALGAPTVEPLCGVGPGNQYQWGELEDSFTLFYGERFTSGDVVDGLPPTVLLKTPALFGVRIENEIGISVGDSLAEAPQGSYQALYDAWMWHDFGTVNGTQLGAIMWTDSGDIVSSIVLPVPGQAGGICT